MAEEGSKKIDNKDALEIYPVLPLRNTVLFPQQIIPIYVGREQSLKLIKDLPKSGKKYIVVVAQKDGSVENPSSTDLYEFGTLAMVMKVFDMPDDSKSAIVKGLKRVKLTKFMKHDVYYKCEYESVESIADHDHLEMQALSGNVKSLFSK